MAGRRPRDPGAVLAILPVAEREVVATWTRALIGMGPEAYWRLPPLRGVVEARAVALLAERFPGLSREAAYLEAGAALGLEGWSVQRKLRTWWAA
jgi:hypothetical protein